MAEEVRCRCATKRRSGIYHIGSNCECAIHEKGRVTRKFKAKMVELWER